MKMTSSYNQDNFMGYINNPMSREDMVMLYKENNVKFEKCELYSDFAQSLISLIFDTYMGDDVTNYMEQAAHFNWCWNKNISNFMKEGINFDNDLLFDYFLEFMMETFYSSTDKTKIEIMNKGLLRLWLNLFDYDKTKTNSDMDALIEIYKIFENSIKIS